MKLTGTDARVGGFSLASNGYHNGFGFTGSDGTATFNVEQPDTIGWLSVYRYTGRDVAKVPAS